MKPLAERIALVAILVASLWVALVWVVRVPFFQEPDESAHADYAFSIFSTGHLVRTLDRSPATDLHPTVRYLEDAAAFRTMRYNPDGRVPPAYGSAAYFRAVNDSAPRVPGKFLDADSGRIPYVAQYYSYFYYALDALAIGAGAFVAHGAASAEFFAARAFGLVLLALSLWLTYATLRELHVKPPAALALLLAIGLFPLTSWVSAYVQPDNLAFTAVALALYASIRARRESDPLRAAAWLGAALGVLALTKADYFVAVAIPALADRTLRFAARPATWRAWLAYGALAAGPALVLGATARAIAHGAADTVAAFVSANGDPIGDAARHGIGPLVAYLGAEAVRGWNALFFDGISFVSYWGAISWTGTRIAFGSPALTDAVFTALGVASQLVALMVAARIAFGVWPRLVRIARRRGIATMLRLLASDVPLNAYVLFATIILAIYVSTGGSMGTQGRYWLPLILPAVLCATRVAPRALRPIFRKRLAFVLGGALVAYSIVGAVAALGTLQARFYASPATLHTEEAQAQFTRVGQYPVATLFALDDTRLFGPKQTIDVEGWAFDSRSGLPARAVALEVDGRLRSGLRYGIARPDVVGRFHDDGLLDTGFGVRLGLAGLAPGRHELRLAIAERGRSEPYPSRARVAFTIAGDP